MERKRRGNHEDSGEPVLSHGRLHVPEAEPAPLEEELLLGQVVRLGHDEARGVPGWEGCLLKDEDNI